MKKIDQIAQKVRKYCESQGMLDREDKILVGVSGGADSVCLLFLLREMRKYFRLQLRVVHVNHGIREEAQEDADFVKGLCHEMNVPFLQENVDVPALAKNKGLSEEEAGRVARYQIFETLAKKWQKDGETVKIALAHHAGDRAETLLFHLFRGTGIKGMGSIPPVRETQVQGVLVIRPLLCLEREEIEFYLGRLGISYCQDRTNSEETYARNRIRHHVIPYAEKEISRGTVRHLNQAAEMLAETESYLAEETRKAMEACVVSGMSHGVNAEKFLEFPELIQKRILMELLRAASPKRRDLEAVHVQAVLGLFRGESGKSVDLPFGIHARREYKYVYLERKAVNADMPAAVISAEKEAQKGMIACVDHRSMDDEAVTVDFGGERFEFRKFSYKKTMVIPQKNYTKWFDYDKIKDTLSIRTRHAGDYLMIRGPEGKPVRKLLKEYFITEKVPRTERDRIALLAMGQEILWIPGYRISESVKVDEGTKKILQIRCLRPEDPA